MDGVFVLIRPSVPVCTATTSVNVPPVSMPILMPAVVTAITVR